MNGLRSPERNQQSVDEPDADTRRPASSDHDHEGKPSLSRVQHDDPRDVITVTGVRSIPPPITTTVANAAAIPIDGDSLGDVEEVLPLQEVRRRERQIDAQEQR